MDENRFLKLSIAWLAVTITVYIVVFLMVIPLVTMTMACYTYRW